MSDRPDSTDRPSAYHDRPARTPRTPLWQPSQPEPARAVLREDASGDLVPEIVSGRTSTARRAVTDQKDSPRFAGALGWTVLGTLIPGAGLIRAGRKAAGIAVLLLLAAGVASLAWLASERRTALAAAVNTKLLMAVSGALVVVAVLWAAIIASTYLSLRPRRVSAAQRVLGAGLVGVLAFAVSAPMAVGALYTYQQATLVDQIFGPEQKSQTRPTITPGSKDDPWANTPRVNILLVGGDYGENRPEADKGFGENTDTMILASIDTKTGNAVLVSVPRNMMKMPFPASSPLHKHYPDGYPEMANSIWANIADEVPADILGPTSNLGADALKLGIGEALGQRVDYYVYVNIDGLYTLIDALGGIKVNVNERIPIAGTTEGKAPTGWIEPGQDKRLDAYQAMWYARSRSGASNGDFDRMGRQRCVINAIIKQADPATMLTRYEAIAKAGTKMVKTDIPQDMLPMMVELALRVKGASMQSMQFTDGENGFLSMNPNFPLMRAQVAQAVAASVGTPATTAPATTGAPSTTAAPAPSAPATTAPASRAPSTTAAPATTKATPTAPKSTAPSAPASATTPPSQNITDACAYNPVAPASASPTRR